MKRLLPFILLLFVGCDVLTEGEVVGKAYYPAHEYLQTTMTSFDGGKTFSPIITTVYIPNRWEVKIKGWYRHELLTESHSISQEMYDTIKIGQHLKLP